MPLPEPDEDLGEAAPTQTRSGVMDSLLKASLLRYSVRGRVRGRGRVRVTGMSAE